MDSLNFVNIIFMFFYSFSSTITVVYSECDIEVNNKTFHQCLDRWSLFRNKQPSHTTWLTDDFLTKEICLGDVSIDDIDRCIQSRVDSSCDAITTYWRGTKQKFMFLCKWRNEFLNYYRCRADVSLTRDVNSCIKICHENVNAGADYCWSTRYLRQCLHKAFKLHCSTNAQEFFKIVFDLELAPSMIYAGCNEDFSTLSRVESIDDSSGRETNSASRRHHRRGHPTRRKQHGKEIRRVFRVEYQRDNWDVASQGKIDRPYFVVLILMLFILRLFT